MKTLAGLKISICQMKVSPGRPDLNAAYMAQEIEAAAKRKADIIAFPELCVTGYLIGDLYEDECFVRDVARCNEQIRVASSVGITVIFGSVTAEAGKIGEDGRLRKHNTVLVASSGDWIGERWKTLQPNYRIFDDDRHLYSLRKQVEEAGRVFAALGAPADELEDVLSPFTIPTRIGDLKLGTIICEDMWCADYPHNPTGMLVENGAELIVNISASPWSWQKNRKRHRVVKELLAATPVPFVYVNNTGIQNTGKNIVVFDGSSTIYRPDGEIIFEVAPYWAGTEDYLFTEMPAPVGQREDDDTSELFVAVVCAMDEFFHALPPAMRQAVIGLSGGIDSAVSASLAAQVLGPDKVLAVNMPSRHNSEQTKSLAARIAADLGINYEVRPIQPIVDSIMAATGVEADTLAYENVQARARMEVLAGIAQKRGGVFIANWNKIEAAFGYGTLYGDMAGFFAPLGDLVKREVYQLADYLNREVYSREVIPQECFDIAPSAELSAGQRDPFDYGKIKRRGYHDEMVRAFTEFRRNPEWFLEMYLRGRLETELKLEAGTLKRLFPTALEFLGDLEKNWNRFYGAYFKRVQSAPIPIVSKRAFGTDLRESILPAYLTQRYRDLKRLLLARPPRGEQIAIFGGSFNPPGIHHRRIAETLADRFDRVIVVPCGQRPDKASAGAVTDEHRAAMVQLNFGGIGRIEIDCFDLKSDAYLPTCLMEERYRSLYPKAELWHVVGADLLVGGGNGKSQIQRDWHRGREIWQDINFVVMVRPGYELGDADLPPKSQVIEIPGIFGSGTMVRRRIAAGEPINDLVLPEVREYITTNRLYRKAEIT